MGLLDFVLVINNVDLQPERKLEEVHYIYSYKL